MSRSPPLEILIFADLLLLMSQYSMTGLPLSFTVTPLCSHREFYRDRSMGCSPLSLSRCQTYLSRYRNPGLNLFLFDRRLCHIAGYDAVDNEEAGDCCVMP